jgi:hypothetical protein
VLRSSSRPGDRTSGAFKALSGRAHPHVKSHGPTRTLAVDDQNHPMKILAGDHVVFEIELHRNSGLCRAFLLFQEAQHRLGRPGGLLVGRGGCIHKPTHAKRLVWAMDGMCVGHGWHVCGPWMACPIRAEERLSDEEPSDVDVQTVCVVLGAQGRQSLADAARREPPSRQRGDTARTAQRGADNAHVFFLHSLIGRPSLLLHPFHGNTIGDEAIRCLLPTSEQRPSGTDER